MTETTETKSNFIHEIIDADLHTGKIQKVITRFPPEPNGYLHIGHAKSINLNFSTALKYIGACHLRFDDTNPCKEEDQFVQSIQEDIKWLGFNWTDKLYYTSDYFPQLYEFALRLIKKGLAYVCDLSPAEIKEYRGTLTQPGKDSPYRNRTIDENLSLFEQMKKGEIEGKVLRAKIDMASPNLNMRDPIMYRVLKAHHHRTGDTWNIYPMYDFAHGQSDSIEGITHSICTLEFEDHRPLYNWFVEKLEIHQPQQIEFARLNLTYTVMSKRKLLQLVETASVDGWDDPRMPTIAGLRRRGFTPEAIRNFCDRIGVNKMNSIVDLDLLNFFVRKHLNKIAQRVMVVMEPLKVVITNYPDDQIEQILADNNPEDDTGGQREVPFSKIIYIEKTDFMEDAPRKYFRLSPGKEVRLKHAYYITCNEVIKDSSGAITELHCTYDPETKGGSSPDGRKVKGTLHWVSAAHAIEAEIREYDNLFSVSEPDQVEEGKTFLDNLNPDSLKIRTIAKLEPSLKTATLTDKFQFMRTGYFCLDKDSSPEKLIFNKTIGLKDSWSKIKNR